MDEPTNHLDNAMVSVAGRLYPISVSRCELLMVTHDRYFLDNVYATRIVEVDRRQAIQLSGTNYAEFAGAERRSVSRWHWRPNARAAE